MKKCNYILNFDNSIKMAANSNGATEEWKESEMMECQNTSPKIDFFLIKCISNDKDETSINR